MGLSLMEALQHPTPNGANTNKFQCWGVEEGWLPKPWRDAQVHKTRTGLPAQKAGSCGWGGEVQQHQSHSEHDTMGRIGDREEIKTKPGRICPGLPGSLGA